MIDNTGRPQTQQRLPPVYPGPRMDFGGATPATSFTLRDTFAMHIAQAIITHDGVPPTKEEAAVVAADTYMIADTLFAERAKTMGYKKKKDHDD